MNGEISVDKQEIIKLLKNNEIIPDSRCSQEDLEALISDEEIDIKDNQYIVLSQKNDYMRECVVLKVFDIKEQAYKTIDMPLEYLKG
jgi:hypothetical protein